MSDHIAGPNVDGFFIPDYPGRLVAQKKVDSTVQVIVAHNSNEGLLFTDPRIQDQAGFKSYFAALMPSISSTKIDQLANTVYPPDYSGAQPYINPTQRVTLAIGEALINCLAFGLDTAYNNATRGYQFAAFPGVHAQDVPYTFWNGETTDSFGLPVNGTIAQKMQSWFTDFTILGTTGTSAALQLPTYGSQATVLNITGNGFPTDRDPAANSRCNFWLTGLYS
jgi:hypothetical protein